MTCVYARVPDQTNGSMHTIKAIVLSIIMCARTRRAPKCPTSRSKRSRSRSTKTTRGCNKHAQKGNEQNNGHPSARQTRRGCPSGPSEAYKRCRPRRRRRRRRHCVVNTHTHWQTTQKNISGRNLSTHTERVRERESANHRHHPRAGTRRTRCDLCAERVCATLKAPARPPPAVPERECHGAAGWLAGYFPHIKNETSCSVCVHPSADARTRAFIICVHMI